MNKKCLAFYVSSHGFGHMTRCLAIMEELLETTEHLIYLASGTYQNSFARVYLARFGDRVTYRDIRTEVGLVNKDNSLQVDIPRLEQELTDFMASWDTAVAAEVAILRDLPVVYVISDISAIGIQVGEQLGVRNIGIANFTWCEQYEFLGLSETIIARFREVYAKLGLLIEYDLMLPSPKLPVPRKQIGFICRRFNPDRIAAIKAQYGSSIFITCGKSADLNNIQIDNYDGTIFTTSGINITSTATVVQLPVETFDTHNYLAASDIVIAKAGWGTISEALLSKRNLVLIEREGVLEDTKNIEELKRRGVAVSIKESDLALIDMHAIKVLIEEN
ncbi:glycosyltransferase, partial [Trichococcus shcherbakoviae]